MVYGYEENLILRRGCDLSAAFRRNKGGDRPGRAVRYPYTTEGETQVICSEELFSELTGMEEYTVIDMQLKRNASDEDVQRIRAIVEETEGAGAVAFSDRRLSNSEAVGYRIP